MNEVSATPKTLHIDTALANRANASPAALPNTVTRTAQQALASPLSPTSPNSSKLYSSSNSSGSSLLSAGNSPVLELRASLRKSASPPPIKEEPLQPSAENSLVVDLDVASRKSPSPPPILVEPLQPLTMASGYLDIVRLAPLDQVAIEFKKLNFNLLGLAGTMQLYNTQVRIAPSRFKAQSIQKQIDEDQQLLDQLKPQIASATRLLDERITSIQTQILKRKKEIREIDQRWQPAPKGSFGLEYRNRELNALLQGIDPSKPSLLTSLSNIFGYPANPNPIDGDLIPDKHNPAEIIQKLNEWLEKIVKLKEEVFIIHSLLEKEDRAQAIKTYKEQKQALEIIIKGFIYFAQDKEYFVRAIKEEMANPKFSQKLLAEYNANLATIEGKWAALQKRKDEIEKALEARKVKFEITDADLTTNIADDVSYDLVKEADRLLAATVQLKESLRTEKRSGLIDAAQKKKISTFEIFLPKVAHLNELFKGAKIRKDTHINILNGRNRQDTEYLNVMNLEKACFDDQIKKIEDCIAERTIWLREKQFLPPNKNDKLPLAPVPTKAPPTGSAAKVLKPSSKGNENQKTDLNVKKPGEKTGK